MKNLDYDVIIIGAGPGGIFSAYELATQNPNLRIGVFEAGKSACQTEMSHRRCACENLLSLQNLCDHERIWRGRRIFGREIQHHKRFRRDAL